MTEKVAGGAIYDASGCGCDGLGGIPDGGRGRKSAGISCCSNLTKRVATTNSAALYLLRVLIIHPRHIHHPTTGKRKASSPVSLTYASPRSSLPSLLRLGPPSHAHLFQLPRHLLNPFQTLPTPPLKTHLRPPRPQKT